MLAMPARHRGSSRTAIVANRSIFTRTTMSPPSLVVFSHLRWDFVYQRPQQLLSRLSARRRVLFIEEPVHAEGAAPRWERETRQGNVLVCRPHTPHNAPGFNDGQLTVLRSLIRRLLAEEEIYDYVLW